MFIIESNMYSFDDAQPFLYRIDDIYHHNIYDL